MPTPDPDAVQARLASLRGITMAKRKKVDVHTPAALGVTPSAHVTVAGVTGWFELATIRSWFGPPEISG